MKEEKFLHGEQILYVNRVVKKSKFSSLWAKNKTMRNIAMRNIAMRNIALRNIALRNIAMRA